MTDPRDPAGPQPGGARGAPERGTKSRADLARSAERRRPGAAAYLDGSYGRPDAGRQRARRLTVAAFFLALAALIVVGGVTVLRPAVSGLAFDLATGNPTLMRYPFFGDVVKERLGRALTDAAGRDATPVVFIVSTGATTVSVAQALAEEHLLADPLAFEYLAITSRQTGQLLAGRYTLVQTMTPGQILARLQQPPDPKLTLAVRQGLRLEQIAAYLETRGLQAGVATDFYALATHPTAELMAAYPFLSAIPAGRSLEGFMGSGTFQVDPTATGEQILRQLLDFWRQQVGPTVIQQAQAAGAGFYRTLILASIVQQEVAVDSERALVAGVYANRLNPRLWSTGILNADPTVIYANDTVQLRALAFEQWQLYSFWNPLKVALADLPVPADLASFQTYVSHGLPAWPICSPGPASIQAAIAPDTAAGYLYFVAKNDGSHSHAFARTAAEHTANLRLYGYLK